MKKGSLLFALTLGILLIANTVESRCTCKEGKWINDFCCESANTPTKDACCHVDGLKKNPPKWVPDDGPDPEPEPETTKIPEPPVTETEPPIVTPDVLPPDECSKPNDQCDKDSDCKGNVGEYCKCAACHCVCEKIDTGVCTAEDICMKDQDCRGGLPGDDRDMCKCVDCVCDCKMSPDGCSPEEECQTDQQCLDSLGPVEIEMECRCEGCECFCDIAVPEKLIDGPLCNTAKDCGRGPCCNGRCKPSC